MSEQTHNDLCEIAKRWLKRPVRANGHGCDIAFSEVKSGISGEIPDAIGFRRSDDCDGSAVVEVKVSRADFLADHRKPHRQEAGLGNWRYYMCPEKLIQPEEVPARWGLVWVNKRGHIKVKKGFSLTGFSFEQQDDAMGAFWHESDRERESYILVRILRLVHDAEEVHGRLRDSYREQSRLAARVNKLVRRSEEDKQHRLAISNQFYQMKARCEALEAHCTPEELGDVNATTPAPEPVRRTRLREGV